MPQTEENQDHLSDYERAVCYYTLPRVISPVSQGAILAYGLCLFAAAGTMTVAVISESTRWLYAGSGALGVMVLFGLIVFPARALANSIRKRRVLEAARDVPDALENETPDPFADHILLRHPLYRPGALYALTDNDADIEYFVDFGPDGRWWKVKSAQDEEVCRIKVLEGMPSFLLSIGSGYPARIAVYKEDKVIATIERQFSIRDPRIEISLAEGDNRRYVVRQQGVYEGNRLVGRTYALRHAYYLDIERSALNAGTLAYFVTVM